MTDVSFRPETIDDAVGVATESARQVAEIARRVAGDMPAALRGFGNSETAAALHEAGVLTADLARQLMSHSQAQLDQLTADRDAALAADLTNAAHYAGVLR